MPAAAVALSSPDDDLRQKIMDAIDKALERGWQATVIGCLLGGDLNIVAKFKSGHTYRPATLLTFESRLYLLDIPPPLNKAQRFLTS